MGVAPPPRIPCEWCGPWKRHYEAFGAPITCNRCGKRLVWPEYVRGALSLVEPNPFGQLSITEGGRLSFSETEDL